MPPSSVDHCWNKARARCLTPKSSSPHTSAMEAALAGGGVAEVVAADLLVFVAAILVDFVEPLGHVLDGIPKRIADKERFLLGAHQGQAIGGAGVNFNELSTEFIFLLENEPSEIGVVFEVVDHRALDRDVEPLADAVDEIVSERPFLGGIPEEHANHRSHVVLDLDDEHFFLVPHEDRASAVRGEDAANLDRDDVVL